MLLSLRHWGQVLSQALSGTVGHCEHMSGTVGLSGCRAVGLSDTVRVLSGHCQSPLSDCRTGALEDAKLKSS